MASTVGDYGIGFPVSVERKISIWKLSVGKLDFPMVICCRKVQNAIEYFPCCLILGVKMDEHSQSPRLRVVHIAASIPYRTSDGAKRHLLCRNAGTTVSWYSSFWTFVAAYCNERFGDEWCLTPEESILVISGATVVPKQVLVRVRRGSNTVQQLLHGTSIFNITASIPDNRLRDAAYGLYHYPLAEALLRCSPDFFRSNQMECRACLSALEPDQTLKSAVRSVGGEAYAGRLIGALKAVGRTDAADFVRMILHDEGRRIEESNPFEQPVEPVEARTSSPLAVRLRLMWAEMRKRVLSVASDKGMSPVLHIHRRLALYTASGVSCCRCHGSVS